MPAPRRPPSRTGSRSRAKSPARTQGSIFPAVTFAIPAPGTSCGTHVLLEDIDELGISTGDILYRILSRDLLCAQIHQRGPETRTADGEAGESAYSRRASQPLPHLLIVFASAEDDAADSVAPAATSRADQFFAILAFLE